MIAADTAQAFLREAAGYFERLPVNGEDAAHWANLSNAENCRKVAELVRALSSEEQPISPAAGRACNAGLDETIPLPRGSEQSREEIARVIDPWYWNRRDYHPDRGHLWTPEVQVSLLKADAILALFSTAHAEGLGKEDEYGVQTHVEPQHCTGWRDIASAPWEPAPGEQWVLLWNSHWRGVGRRWAGYDGDPGFCDEATEFVVPEPTHWMPLPAPPSSELTDQQRGAPLEGGE